MGPRLASRRLGAERAEPSRAEPSQAKLSGQLRARSAPLEAALPALGPPAARSRAEEPGTAGQAALPPLEPSWAPGGAQLEWPAPLHLLRPAAD